MRQYILATTPGGKTYRWGEDEFSPDRVFEDLQDSDSVPGGCKELNCSLPRKAGVDYADMQGGTQIQLFGAAQYKVWEGTLQDAPRTSGDRLVMSPAAVGYQSYLSDDESAREIFIDADMTAWGAPSTDRLVGVGSSQQTNANAQVSLVPAGDVNSPYGPSVDHKWAIIDNTPADVAESWYDSGGIEIGRVELTFGAVVNSLGPGWSTRVVACDDSKPSTFEQLAQFNGNSFNNWAGEAVANRRFLGLISYFTGPAEKPIQSDFQYRQIKVLGRHGLPLYGAHPQVGVLASDVIAYALASWAPLINFSTGSMGTIRPTSFPIPHLPFKESTTVQDMIDKANRFELNEWAVWPGQFGPTFHLNPRGEREGRKRWRGRVGPTQLRETGQSMRRVFNGVVVQYQDVDGATRVIAPTGSGYQLTSDRLLDGDPLNPANQIPGLRKWAKIAMKRVATNLGAEETAERFLEQTKLLDGSGEATLTGFVEDEHGAEWPYYYVKSGDLFDPMDSSNPGYRYIISANRTRSSRSSAIALDAPLDSYEALLERLDVEEMGIG